VNCHWQRQTEVRIDKYVPLPHCLPQIWHGLDRDWTHASTLTDWQPVTWAIKNPSSMASPVWIEPPWIFQLVNQLVYLWSGYIRFAFRAVSLTCKRFWFMQDCTLWWHAEFLVHCHGGWRWFGISPVRNILTTVLSCIFVRTGTQTLGTVCCDRKICEIYCVFLCVSWIQWIDSGWGACISSASSLGDLNLVFVLVINTKCCYANCFGVFALTFWDIGTNCQFSL
jgi:hypothetical protein